MAAFHFRDILAQTGLETVPMIACGKGAVPALANRRVFKLA